jgi:hypothetical protein
MTNGRFLLDISIVIALLNRDVTLANRIGTAPVVLSVTDCWGVVFRRDEVHARIREPEDR